MTKLWIGANYIAPSIWKHIFSIGRQFSIRTLYDEASATIFLDF